MPANGAGAGAVPPADPEATTGAGPAAGGGPGRLSREDEAIFAELQRDGRLPFTALAERIGTSEANVRRRVRALTERDVFSVTAVADPRVLGLDHMAWVGLVVRPGEMASVAEALVEMTEVDYVVLSSGVFGVMAEVACASATSFYELVARIRRLPGVRRSETFPYLRLVHQRFQWTAPTDPGVRWTGVPGTPAGRDGLSETDVAIVRELEHDGRASFRDIASRIGESERLVSRRVTQMVEEGVVRVIAVGNPLTLGFSTMAWLGIVVDPHADAEAVLERLSAIRAIDYVVVVAGRFDVMAEIVCRSGDELVAALGEEIGAIDGIASVETSLYLRLLYTSTAGAWGVGRSMASLRGPG